MPADFLLLIVPLFEEGSRSFKFGAQNDDFLALIPVDGRGGLGVRFFAGLVFAAPQSPDQKAASKANEERYRKRRPRRRLEN